MNISYEEVMDAMLTNNTARVSKILAEFDSILYFTSTEEETITAMFSLASAMCLQGKLSDNLAEKLIERTATTIDILPFLQLVVVAKNIKVKNYDKIPHDICYALLSEEYTDRVGQSIEHLESDVFADLIAFIVNESVECANVKFNLPIVKHIYQEKTIPRELLFAYMGLCPRETIKEYFVNLFNVFLNEDYSNNDYPEYVDPEFDN